MSIFGPQNRTARPLNGQSRSYRSGSLGLRGPYVSRDGSLGQALGQALGVTPWQCWNVEAFKTCHANNWAANQKECTTGGVAARDWNGNVDNCINALTDLDDGACVTKHCQQYAPAPLPNISTISIAKGKEIQTKMNALLKAAGYKPITVDGVIGKATCGADAILNSGLLAGYQGLCSGGVYTYPTMVGSTTPVSVSTIPTTTVIPGQTAPALIVHQWNQADEQMAALQTDCNRILDQNEMLSIPVTGKLDAATCGAMKWIKENTGADLLSSSGQNCQGFTTPGRKPGSISPANQKPGDLPPSSLLPNPPPPGGMTSASVLTGGLILLAAGGAYYYAKKQGYV